MAAMLAARRGQRRSVARGGDGGMTEAATALAFGSLLRRYRLAAGLTQEELAERAGISKRSLSDMERGLPHRPRPQTVALLAEALLLAPPNREALAAAARRAGRPAAAARADEQATGPALVGRTAELALLERHLAGDGPPLLLLAGEPGIGKTRLLQAALPRAEVLGRHVLSGGCHRRGGQDPYAPLAGALQRFLRRCPPPQQRGALAGCAWLVRLLPELAAGPIPPRPAWTLTPEQERRLMGEAVVRVLANVAGPAGTVLLLDDLQWAGPDALDLLALLARSAAEVPLRIVGTYRDTEVQSHDPLSSLLADLAQAGLAAQRLLGPLDPEEAATLLDTLLVRGTDEAQSTRRAEVLRRSGGVPFYVVSCAQAVQREGGDGATREAVPWDIGQSIRQRLAALPEAARELAGAAAVVGRVVPPALLTGVVARPEDDVVAALEALCHARLLEDQGENAYRFAHDVIREVVEDGLGTARRTLLHQRIARALERQPGAPPVEALAYHYARAREHGAAAHWLERAGDHAAAAFANGAALEHYAAARDHLVFLHTDAASLSRVAEKLGDVHLLIGALEHAEEEFGRARVLERDPIRRAELRRKEALSQMRRGAYDQALQTLDAADAEGGGADGSSPLPAGLRAALELSRGEVYIRVNRKDDAEPVAEHALELLNAEPPGPLREQALVLADRLLSSVAFFHGDVAGSETIAQRALVRCERLGDREGVAWWWQSRGYNAWMFRHLADAEAHFRHGLDVAGEIGAHERSSECWRGLGAIAMERQDLDGAEDCLRQAIACGERGSSPLLSGRAWEWWAAVARERGDLDTAIARLREAAALLDPLTTPRGLLMPWLSLGWCLWQRGDLAAAEECLRNELPRDEGIRGTDALTRTYLCLGGVLRDRGDHAAALRWLRLARRTARRSSLGPLEVEATAEQGQIYLLVGQRRPATVALRQAQRVPDAEDVATAITFQYLLEAEMHLQDGRLAAAQTMAARALERAGEAEAQRVHRATSEVGSLGRVLQGRAQRVLGVCALRLGAHAEAQTQLRVALALHLEVGATLEAARTRLLLAEALAAGMQDGSIPAEARALLAEAEAQFAKSGADVDLAQSGQVAARWVSH
jgi:tetratricopeptide (TPR) repeat protein/transcriptional regulator with XRE-family HTH domain